MKTLFWYASANTLLEGFNGIKGCSVNRKKLFVFQIEIVFILNVLKVKDLGTSFIFICITEVMKNLCGIMRGQTLSTAIPNK